MQPIPVACTLHPYIWPSISSIWPFVCWLQLAGGWAGAPLGLGRRQSPPQETRRPPVTAFNKPAEEFFNGTVS